MAAAHEHLSWATTRQTDAAEATRRAEQSLKATLDGIEALSDHYVSQMLAARHRQSGKLNTLLGVNLGSSRPSSRSPGG